MFLPRPRPLSALAFALTLALAGPATAGGLKPVTAVEGITEYRLPNGLQVLLAPDDSKPSTTVNMTYRVGSKHENYGETGMAHLLEHLLFKGSPRHREPWSEFTKRGLDANGSTWFDRTNYFAAFAANDDNLRWYLDWQADAMVNSFIARRHLDTEMTVVRNEMERGENDAAGIAIQRALSAMYDWHNYGKDTIGARADIENVDIGRLQAFYRRYYQPDNATLVVSGKFDPAKVLTWIERSFGRIAKPARMLPRLYTIDPVQDGERMVTVRRVGGAAQSYVGYHMPPGAHPDQAAVELLNLILADAPSGRLHKRLVEEKKLAATVGNFGLALAEPGFTLLIAELAPKAAHDELNREMLAVIEGFAERPVSADELRRARARWLNEWERRYASPEQVGITLSETIAQGDWRLFFLLRDRVKALTLEDLQRVALERFLPANRTLAQYVPTDKPQRAPAPAFVDVAAEMRSFKPAPAAAAVPTFDASPASIERAAVLGRLPVGMKTALLAKPTRGGAVQGVITLHLGDAGGLTGQQSVAELAAALLDMGTARLNREQLRDALEAAKVGLKIEAPAADTLNMRWSTTREHAAQALSLLAEMLKTPRYDAAALEELRAQMLSALQAQRDDPQAIAGNAAAVALNQHPRGDLRHARSFAEQEADLKAATLAAVKAFHARFYGAENAELALVGDFDVAAVQTAASAGFGDWKAQSAYARTPRSAAAVAGRQQLLQTPDKQNATLIGVLALPLTDAELPASAALQLANHILGGGGSSRLWTRIREQDGLSYGVGSHVQLNPKDPSSSWSLYAIFAPQNRAKVEAALRAEVARALNDGFSAREVAEAKAALLNQRRLALAQDDQLAGLLASQLELGRRMERVQQLDAAIAATSVADVNAALRRHFKLDGFQLVFAGDFK